MFTITVCGAEGCREFVSAEDLYLWLMLADAALNQEVEGLDRLNDAESYGYQEEASFLPRTRLIE